MGVDYENKEFHEYDEWPEIAVIIIIAALVMVAIFR
jgi:hypothetical protein